MFQLPPSSSSTFPQMAPNQSELTLVAFLISTLFAITAVQSSNSCTSTLIDLSSCLNYISGNTTTPPSSCCSQLRSTNLEPQCLCTFLFGGGGSALGISINKTQALALPDACNVHTPSIVQCFASLPPPSSGSPSTPDTPSGVGSNVVPSVDTSGAYGNTVKISIMISVSLIFMVVLASASVISV